MKRRKLGGNDSVQDGSVRRTSFKNYSLAQLLSQDRSSCSFLVKGQPRPLERARFNHSIKKMFNPSSKNQAEFRALIKEALPLDEDKVPFFKRKENIIVDAVFKMKRPLSHYKPDTDVHGLGSDRLKESAPKLMYGGPKVDVDNLVKLVLDALIGYIYEDDCQVVSIQSSKIYDSDDDCRGSTVIKFRVADEDELSVITNVH